MQTPTPLLRSFEELGAINSEFGLFTLKPFRDWKNSVWSDKVFKMRLCNAGDLLDIFTQCQDTAENARIQAMKIEILIRSIYSIDDRRLISAEDLKRYNDDNNVNLSELEFLRMWMKNLEQVVIERLDLMYNALQQKQLRHLSGSYMCGVCGNIFYEKPQDAKDTKYMPCEIVCADCLPSVVNTDLYDFADAVPVKHIFDEPEEIISEEAPEDPGFICPNCSQTFPTVEELSEHRLDCSNT